MTTHAIEMAQWRAKNPEKARVLAIKNKQWRREWRIANRELANKTAREESARWRAKYPDKAAARAERRKPARREQGKRLYKQRRDEILEFFGDKCVRCAFRDKRALQLDHIHGGGGKERKNGKANIGEQYALMLADPETAHAKYQLLCANCNILKYYVAQS